MRKQPSKRHSSKSALITIILLVVIGAGFCGVFLWEKEEARREQEAASPEEAYGQTGKIITYQGDTYAFRDELDTYLFMGLDERASTVNMESLNINNVQADFLFLMVADHSRQTYFGVHINRDTMAEVPILDSVGATQGTYIAQIALAHAYGTGGKDSCRNQVKAVSRLLYDLPIDHYVALKMEGIATFNDTVGGVVVHIDDDFSKVDPSLKQGADVRLWGKQAEVFVRSRYSVDDGSNLSRMRRQRAYINALIGQLNIKLSESDRFSYRLADAMSEYIVSDLTTMELSGVSENLKNFRFSTIYTIDGEAIKGNEFMEFYPDENALRDLVLQLFYRQIEEK